MIKLNSLYPILIIIFIILISPLSAAYIVVKLDVKPIFNPGDTLAFSYMIKTNMDREIEYIPFILCPDLKLPFIEPKRIRFKKYQPLIGNYSYIQINESVEPQKCKAVVEVLDPIKIKKVVSFYINTNPSFKFKLLACKNPSCLEKPQIFRRYELIFLNYTSAIKDIEVEAKIILPDKQEEHIKLPASYRPNQIGTYKIKATATKSGYKTQTAELQIGIIPESDILVSCNQNGTCDFPENFATCPQDCPSGTKDGYCDKLQDGRCDPDCNPLDDEDCPVTELFYKKSWVKTVLVIMSGLTLIIIFIVGTVKRRSMKRQEKTIKKLKAYVIASLAKGYKKEQIKGALKKQGWQDPLIKEAFEGLE